MLVTDPALAQVETDLIHIGQQATRDTYNALCKVGQAIVVGRPATLDQAETVAVNRGIALLPIDVQPQAKIFAGVDAQHPTQRHLHDVATSQLQTAIGFVLAQQYVVLEDIAGRST